MADYPTDLSAVVDNTTDVLAKYVNNIEIRLGVKDSAVPDTIDYLTKANPSGFLINGKIVPSVASNDLTVAIKGLNGDDPSASNPVYCRIGDTIRSITAALSVTRVDGTGWFNAGSAELATKEIDYFVYLGYNSTDGVVIGFSRIPYAQIYSDFSTDGAHEKYGAISTITNAVAGDDYELIGRFAATLSAGAGYTWTVPTFTTVNLIQRPIDKTRVLTYVGTTTATTMTLSGQNSNHKYQIKGRNCQINGYSLFVPGGTVNATIKVMAPFITSVTNTGYPVMVVNGGTSNKAGTANMVTNYFNCGDYAGANWTNGAGCYIWLSMVYPIG